MSESSILVVDGHAASRESVSRFLQDAGYAVRAAADPTEASMAMASGSVKMVIADTFILGGPCDGIVNHFKSRDPELPVILMASGGDVVSALGAIRAGASDYLLKPVSREILELAVKRCWRNGNGSGKIPDGYGKSLKTQSFEKTIITTDPGFQKIIRVAQGVAASNATVLIEGESGTGKELLASYIHKESLRRNGPYVALNCAALPETLAESELFGHERGAFTGAITRKPGRFEMAHQGTLVLDEISEMPLSIQAKLLRVLQERVIERVGGTRAIPVDVRIIAISNKNIKTAVKDGRFREDLFYRIHVVPLIVPPLRERRGDIPVLARHFLERCALMNGAGRKDISPETLKLLEEMTWHGNVRELENVIERAILLCEGETLKPEHLFLDRMDNSASAGTATMRAGVSMRDMERMLISETLKEVNGNRTHAARMLGISIRTLRNKLKEYRSALPPYEEEKD